MNDLDEVIKQLEDPRVDCITFQNSDLTAWLRPTTYPVIVLFPMPNGILTTEPMSISNSISSGTIY